MAKELGGSLHQMVSIVLMLLYGMQDGLNVVSEARVAGEDLQGRHKRRKTKEERMKSVLEGGTSEHTLALPLL